MSGAPDALEVVARSLRGSGAVVKPLRVEVAYHSRQINEIHGPLLTALKQIRPHEARIPLFSTVTGECVNGLEMAAGYWWCNVRQPVQFAKAFERVLS